jgi:hypothetical protein
MQSSGSSDDAMTTNSDEDWMHTPDSNINVESLQRAVSQPLVWQNTATFSEHRRATWLGTRTELPDADQVSSALDDLEIELRNRRNSVSILNFSRWKSTMRLEHFKQKNK